MWTGSSSVWKWHRKVKKEKHVIEKTGSIPTKNGSNWGCHGQGGQPTLTCGGLNLTLPIYWIHLSRCTVFCSSRSVLHSRWPQRRSQPSGSNWSLKIESNASRRDPSFFAGVATRFIERPRYGKARCCERLWRERLRNRIFDIFKLFQSHTHSFLYT